MTATVVQTPFTSSVQFFGTQQPSFNPLSVTITMQEFAHDVVQMTVWADDVDSDSYQSGMPMAYTWGRSTVLRSFYGYVNHASRSNNALSGADLVQRNSTTITCMGASWPMKQSGTATFRNMTASQVVAQIAQLFGLAISIVPDTTIWPVLHMAGMSFWEFCVMLAQRIGYTFYCSGVTLFFKPRQTNPNQIAGLVATYNYLSDPGSLPIFMPTIGATNPMGGQLATRTVAGIDPRTTKVVTATVSGSPAPNVLGMAADTPVFARTEHFTVRSQNEANVKTMGAGQSNQLYITACTHGVGDPMIAQGSLVFVLNANGSQNGLWMVTKCVQHLDVKNFTMNMELGRDSMGATATIGGLPSMTATQPVALSPGNAWVAGSSNAPSPNKAAVSATSAVATETPAELVSNNAPPTILQFFNWDYLEDTWDNTFDDWDI